MKPRLIGWLNRQRMERRRMEMMPCLVVPEMTKEEAEEFKEAMRCDNGQVVRIRHLTIDDPRLDQISRQQKQACDRLFFKEGR